MGKYLHKFSFLSSFLVLATLLHGISAFKYKVTNNAKNTPGGARFDKEIGATFASKIMADANIFIWKVFEQYTSADRHNVPVLNLFISDIEGPFMAYTNYDNINFSASAIQKYFPPGKASSRYHFTSIMYHEMTHIFQWSGNRTAPGGLTEGVADYIMVKSKIYDASTYTKPGSGSRWDEGYGVTERFLEYCDGLREGFTVALNKKMRFAYSDNYFMDLLGKPLDQLWRDYKAKYGKSPV
ncbi:uncharacterized protein [Primulina eburnea]|uniref:uncharacterized protein n=1 Tax=Primulina eburnea TaxID=1245227 RepID=UPI003C6C4546